MMSRSFGIRSSQHGRVDELLFGWRVQYVVEVLEAWSRCAARPPASCARSHRRSARGAGRRLALDGAGDFGCRAGGLVVLPQRLPTAWLKRECSPRVQRLAVTAVTTSSAVAIKKRGRSPSRRAGCSGQAVALRFR